MINYLPCRFFDSFFVGDRATEKGAGEMGKKIEMEKFAGSFRPFFGGLAESVYKTTVIRPRRVFILTCLKIAFKL